MREQEGRNGLEMEAWTRKMREAGDSGGSFEEGETQRKGPGARRRNLGGRFRRRSPSSTCGVVGEGKGEMLVCGLILRAPAYIAKFGGDSAPSSVADRSADLNDSACLMSVLNDERWSAFSSAAIASEDASHFRAGRRRGRRRPCGPCAVASVSLARC